MIALFLLLVIAAIVLGIVGVVAKGLLYLLIIGIVVFVAALILAALRMRRRPVDFHRQLIRLIADLSDAAGAFLVRAAHDETRGWQWVSEPL